MAQLIAALELHPGRKIGYREEVHHPALAAPEVAAGTVHVARDGDLVRDQVRPERQISEVGATMLSTRPAPDAEATLYPIPAEARPMLLALRRMLAGDAAAVAADFATDLSTGESGWRLALRPLGDAAGPAPGTAVVFGGCGGDLLSMQMTGRDGLRRVLAFSPGR